MVHLFEWSWADIAIECEEWLGPKGFTAVQVSPPTDHIKHPAWWARYQPVTFKLHSRSGDEAAFVDMVHRCKKSGVGIYVDAVLNQVASGSGVSIAGSHYGNRSTPIWKPEDFHHLPGNKVANCAIKNYQDRRNVQYCDMLGMPDLCTGCPGVRSKMADYLRHLMELGVAGFRIDAAKHIDSGELKKLLAEATGGRSTFWFQEVYNGPGEAVTNDMYVGNGALEYFDYSKRLAPHIRYEGKLGSMHNFGQSWGLLSPDHSVVFLDNHDTQRAEAMLSYRGGRLYELASIFMLAHPYGYPKIMSSFYFSTRDQGPPSLPVHGAHGLACGEHPEQTTAKPGRPWVCEHRWPSLANMVAWRRSAGSNDIGAWWAQNGDNVFFCRGSTACVMFNRAGSNTWKSSLKLPLPPGTYCNVIVSDDPTSCPKVTIKQGGMTLVEVPPVHAVAIHVGAMAMDANTTHRPSSPALPVRHAAKPGHAKVKANPVEEPQTTGLEACISRASKPGGFCSLKSGKAGEFCHASVTLKCCRLNGATLADCCALPEIQSLSEAYRKKADVQRCFVKHPKEATGRVVPDPVCAGKNDNCSKSGCCKHPGHKCYMKNKVWASCLPSCTRGMTDHVNQERWTCLPVKPQQRQVFV
jgi:alpha-amylase